ncbi:PEP-CTERM sorting domain-containing protein [Pseudomonas fluorescens]|nr:PEP-CTERM sorting domain-containing protein [Pseudomonas fluorescens]
MIDSEATKKLKLWISESRRGTYPIHIIKVNNKTVPSPTTSILLLGAGVGLFRFRNRKSTDASSTRRHITFRSNVI